MLCSAVIWFRFEEDAAYQKMEEAFLFCLVWMPVDWFFIYFWGWVGGDGGSQFCFLCLTRLLFFTCVWDGRNQFCLWMFYSGTEDASLIFYDWVGCFTVGWRRLVWWECLLRDVFWSLFVDGFYLWKVDVCFVFCVWWSSYSGMHKTFFVLYWKCRFDENAFGRMRHGLFW